MEESTCDYCTCCRSLWKYWRITGYLDTSTVGICNLEREGEREGGRGRGREGGGEGGREGEREGGGEGGRGRGREGGGEGGSEGEREEGEEGREGERERPLYVYIMYMYYNSNMCHVLNHLVFLLS